jgi:hypothetical protein
LLYSTNKIKILGTRREKDKEQSNGTQQIQGRTLEEENKQASKA